MNDDSILNINVANHTYYHSMCELNKDEIKEDSNNIILMRDNIRILNLNIFLRPPFVKNNDNDWKDERLDEFINQLPNYDIICLQEMFGSFSSRKVKLIRAAARSGFFFYVETKSPSFYSFSLVDGGLLILSRFPIINSTFIAFSYGVIADALSEKGALYAQIKIKNTILHLFTTHLQASYFHSGPFYWKLSFQTRMDQVDQLSRAMSQILDKHFQPGDKIILTGDFNVNALKYKTMKPDFKIGEEVEREYENMLTNLNNYNLKVVDALKYYTGRNPVTFGDYDKDKGYAESTLTDFKEVGSCQSLDYVFEVFYNFNNNLTIDEELNRCKLFIKNLAVEKFLVENKYTKKKTFTQLSDHYGITFDLKYRSNEI